MIFFLSLFLLLRCATSDDQRDKTIDSVVQETPCSTVGGRCTIAVDCPSGHLTELRGLCPTQKYEGVECCYGKIRRLISKPSPGFGMRNFDNEVIRSFNPYKHLYT